MYVVFFKMLKLPENVVGSDFKQHRLAALDTTLINEYEEVVSDWISTIEAILHDTSDERYTLFRRLINSFENRFLWYIISCYLTYSIFLLKMYKKIIKYKYSTFQTFI